MTAFRHCSIANAAIAVRGPAHVGGDLSPWGSFMGTHSVPLFRYRVGCTSRLVNWRLLEKGLVARKEVISEIHKIMRLSKVEQNAHL